MEIYFLILLLMSNVKGGGAVDFKAATLGVDVVKPTDSDVSVSSSNTDVKEVDGARPVKEVDDERPVKEVDEKPEEDSDVKPVKDADGEKERPEKERPELSVVMAEIIPIDFEEMDPTGICKTVDDGYTKYKKFVGQYTDDFPRIDEFIDDAMQALGDAFQVPNAFRRAFIKLAGDKTGCTRHATALSKIKSKLTDTKVVKKIEKTFEKLDEISDFEKVKMIRRTYDLVLSILSEYVEASDWKAIVNTIKPIMTATFDQTDLKQMGTFFGPLTKILKRYDAVEENDEIYDILERDIRQMLFPGRRRRAVTAVANKPDTDYEDYSDYEDVKPAKDVKPSTDYEDYYDDVKPVKDVKPSTDVKPVKDVKPSTDVKPVKDVKPSTDVKPAKDVKPSTNVNPAKDAKPTTTASEFSSEWCTLVGDAYTTYKKILGSIPDIKWQDHSGFVNELFTHFGGVFEALNIYRITFGRIGGDERKCHWVMDSVDKFVKKWLQEERQNEIVKGVRPVIEEVEFMKPVLEINLIPTKERPISKPATDTGSISGTKPAAAKPDSATSSVSGTRPTDGKPVEAKPVEVKPVEASGPVEIKPVEASKPVEPPKAVQRVVRRAAVAAKPVEVDAKPTGSKPAAVDDKPTDTRPKPTDTEPSAIGASSLFEIFDFEKMSKYGARFVKMGEEIIGTYSDADLLLMVPDLETNVFSKMFEETERVKLFAFWHEVVRVLKEHDKNKDRAKFYENIFSNFDVIAKLREGGNGADNIKLSSTALTLFISSLLIIII